MSDNTVRPSTIDGIKSLAKTIKREQGIKHAEALDRAAVAAGFANFAHANRAIADRPRHGLWITARWFDRATRARGQETLRIALGATYAELLTPSQAWSDRYLRNVRAEAPDHLVLASISEDAELARRRVCEVARTMQFVEATGLKPSDSRRTYPSGRIDHRVPGQDHSAVWWDPVNRRHVRTDEPYVDHDAPIDAERLAWADRHGWEIVKPRWGGIYWPDHGCSMFLMADRTKGPSLEGLATALDKLPRPVTATRWNGTSGEYYAAVDTPGTRAAEDAKRDAKPKPRRPARKRASVAYNMTFVGRRLRPDARMPIEAHQEAGALLQSVIADAWKRDGARNRADRIRSDLDEWVMREYDTTELDHETFSNLYYHTNSDGPAPTADRGVMIARLERVKAILASHYPDCRPLDEVMGQADRAIQSLHSWRP
jgi:hypothetical protein